MNGRKWTCPSIEETVKIKDIEKYSRKHYNREKNPESSCIKCFLPDVDKIIPGTTRIERKGPVKEIGKGKK